MKYIGYLYNILSNKKKYFILIKIGLLHASPRGVALNYDGSEVVPKILYLYVYEHNHVQTLILSLNRIQSSSLLHIYLYVEQTIKKYYITYVSNSFFIFKNSCFVK